MNFTCNQCQRRYSLPDDKLGAKPVKIRCRQCNHVMEISARSVPLQEEDAQTRVVSEEWVSKLRAQSAATESKPAKSLPQADRLAAWFAMAKGKQLGPMDHGMLREKFHRGELHPRSYLWKQGMAEWKRAQDLFDPSFLAPPSISDEPTVVAVVEPADSPEKAHRANLDTLFSDADLLLPPSPVQPLELPTAQPRKEVADPFASIAADPSKLPVGDTTRLFMARAGVTRRNPPWKVALFSAGGIGLPVLLLWLLTQLKVVPLTVTTVDDSGREVQESVFSADGVSKLGNLLLGKNKPQPKLSAAVPSRPRPVAAVGLAESTAAPGTNETVQPTPKELVDLYKGSTVGARAPTIKPASAVMNTAKSGLAEEAVAKVVGQNLHAFQGCIEQELRKNPNFRGGKVYVIATVASSGVVTRAEIDRRDIDLSTLGECLKSRAKKMMFASFAGDPTEVQIPLVLSSSL